MPDGKCPACGCTGGRLIFSATDRLYQTTGKLFRLVECRSCRLMRLSPRPGPAELRSYYPEHYWHVPEEDIASQFAEMYRRLVLRDHLRFVRRALESVTTDGPVLDVGCGGGLFLKMLRERGYQGIGVDFSIRAAGVAWEINEVPALCASLAHAPFADGSCAAITMFHLLEHLYDPSSYLRAAHRLLQPDGRLIVQVPNAASWQFLLLGEKWAGADVPRHLWNFKPRDLEVLLDRSGFEVCRTRFFSLRDNPACLATSIAPALDPMARRIRGAGETPNQTLLKNFAYFGLVLAALPFSILEAACRAGCTVMMEARKK